MPKGDSHRTTPSYETSSILEDAPATASEPAKRELTLRAALALSGTSLAFFLTSGFLNSFGVYQDYYTLVLLPSHSQFQISWIGAFALFMFFLPAPIVGIMADRYGPIVPITIGAIIQLFAIFMISLCQQYYQLFLAQGVLLGIGMCFIAIPCSGICPKYFVRARGLATGVTVSGSSLGGVIWPVVADQLLKKDKISFGWTIRIMGFIMVPLFVFVIFAVRLPPDETTSHKDVKERKGNDLTVVESQAPQLTTTVNEEQGKKRTDLSALRKPPFILLGAALFFMNLGFGIPLFFVTTYASNVRIGANLAFYFSSIANGASMFGRILPGWAADRVGKFNVLTTSALVAGIVAFCWTAVDQEAGLIVWTLAYGFASGAILSLTLACGASLVPHEAATTGLGALMGASSLAFLFGTPIGGALLDTGGYIALSCFAGATLFLGAALAGASRLAQSRKLFAAV